jgi:GAF domain-containing protein
MVNSPANTPANTPTNTPGTPPKPNRADVVERFFATVGSSVASLSVRVKLTLFFIAAVVALGGLAWFALVSYDEAVEPLSDTLVRIMATERAAALNALASNYSALVELYATDGAAFDLYEAALADSGENSLAVRQVETLFRTPVNIEASVRSIRFTDMQGRVIASVPEVLDKDDTDAVYFTSLAGAINRIFVGGIQERGVPNVDFARMIHRGAERIGYLVVSIDPAGAANPQAPNFYDSLGAFDTRAGTITFYTVSSQGDIEFTRSLQVLGETNARENALALLEVESRVPFTYASPLTGQTVLGFTVDIPSMNRRLVAETRVLQSNIATEVGRFTAGLLLLLALFTAVLLALRAFLGATILRPISLLLAVTKSRTGTAPKLKQADEIGTLYNTVNTLIAESRQNTLDIEGRVAQRTRALTTVLEIAENFSKVRSIQQIRRMAIERIPQRFPQVAHVLIFEPEPSGQFAVLSAGSGATAESKYRQSITARGAVGRAMTELQPVFTANIEATLHEVVPDSITELAVPMWINNEIIGVLDLHGTTPQAFTDADIDTFRSLANVLAMALYNAREFEQTSTRLAEFEEMNRRLIGDAWRSYNATRRRSLGRISEPWTELQRRAAHEGDVVEQIGEELVTLAMPVMLRGQVIGAVEWDIPRTSYNHNVRVLAHDLVERLALAADNARLFEQSQRLADRERIVNEIATKLSQQTDVRQILQVAVRELGQALRLPQTSIRLAEAAGEGQIE